MSIKLSKFLSDVQDCLGWPYESPGGTSADCSKSGIDCSGLIVRAYKLQGYSIAHGSNTIYRDGSLSDKGELKSVSQLKPGYFVFLRKDWNPDKASDRKNKYFGDEIGNMSHIGVVYSTDPLIIIDASYSFGSVRKTTAIKNVGWTHWGRPAKIEFGLEVAVTPAVTSTTGNLIAKVTAKQYDTVNLRAKANKRSCVLKRIPLGETVTLLSTKNQNGFYNVRYEKWKGYIMIQYLEVIT